ncbi:hypothetical protein Tco_1371973, partial [Tanacetum coccineum]
MTEAKGNGGEWLYVRGRFGQRDIEQGTDSAWSKSHKKSNVLYMSVRGEFEERLSQVESQEILSLDCPSIKQGMLDPVKVKCIFLGYRKGIVGNKALEEDHTFEVEQTQDLIYYHSACDREQHSAWELFSYREDSNEAAFAVAVMCMCSATVAGKTVTTAMTITGSMHQAEIWVTKGLLVKAKGNLLSVEIIRDQGGDCDVEKNGKWSCIYGVRSHKYLMVCTRLNVALADAEAMMLHMMALSPTKAGYMTLTEAAKEAIWLKGLAIESGFELKIVAGIATGALSKAIPGPRFQHRLNLLSIGVNFFKDSCSAASSSGFVGADFPTEHS